MYEAFEYLTELYLSEFILAILIISIIVVVMSIFHVIMTSHDKRSSCCKKNKINQKTKQRTQN